ncbi:1,4-beta-D-xylan synthase [Vigna unguiculata]|uniref:1,4-beta-D-xylan synthase n=1 Tax=Vigna unguiculata TaxID=3917 RepID=A0A4D6LLB4_VIGUN|nr:1,4-beta-D-xylan synthase [Vigna unguiculata]
MFFHRFGGSSALIDSIPVVENQGMSLVDHPTVKYVHPPSVLTISREFIIDSVIMTKAINVISYWYKERIEWQEGVGLIYRLVSEDVAMAYKMHNTV